MHTISRSLFLTIVFGDRKTEEYCCMKAKLFLLGIILFPLFSFSQQPTRNELLRLYYQANLAANNGQIDSAIVKYQTIINLVPRYADPYLKVAQLCEKHADENTEWLGTAITMYRLYLNLELDDTKSAEATIHLRALEDKMAVPHFDEELANNQGSMEDYAPGISEPDKIVEPLPAIPETAQTTTSPTIQPQTEEVLPQTEDAYKHILLESAAKVSENALFINPYTIEIIPENTLASHELKQPDLEKLCGRWVSLSRMSDGREAWIIDIEKQPTELRITLNPNSGIFNLPQWQQSFLKGRSSLLSLANDFSIVTTRPDITMGTMKMFDNLQSKITTGQINNAGFLSFKYGIDLTYTPTSDKYEWAKSGIQFLGSLIGGLTGLNILNTLITNVANSLINKTETSDTNINYVGSIEFTLKPSSGFMLGSCKEFLAESLAKGPHELKNRIFESEFCKVDTHYPGYSGNYSTKTEDVVAREKAIIEQLSKAEQTPENKYLLGMLYAYNYGKDEFAEAPQYSKDAMQALQSAAEGGNVDALSFLTNYFFCLSLGDKLDNLPQSYGSSSMDILMANATLPPKNVRKASLQYAQQYLVKLQAIAPAKAKIIEAEYKINKSRDIDAALYLFKEAAQMGDACAMNRTGEILLFEYNKTTEAFEWFSKASDLNEPNAMLNMALLYRDGKGVSQDVAQYITWLLRSYEYGNLNALDELSNAYTKGIGVSQDYNQALRYIDLKQDIAHDRYSYLLKMAEIEKQ